MPEPGSVYHRVADTAVPRDPRDIDDHQPGWSTGGMSWLATESLIQLLPERSAGSSGASVGPSVPWPSFRRVGSAASETGIGNSRASIR